MADPATRQPRSGRSESREHVELRALREQQPELAHAVDMHLELLDVQRRVQARIPLPSFDFNARVVTHHQNTARPVLRFEDIPIELTDLRLVVRQTIDILRRFDALDAAEVQQMQALGRDEVLLSVVADWYRATAERHVTASVAATAPVSVSRPASTTAAASSSTVDQVLTVAIRPFLSRCAETVQQRPELALWEHPYCLLCGGEPELAVITPAAERHLICSQCGLHWKFEPLTCPFCRNSDRSRITSFATPDGQYRVYGCDVCTRYLKAYDGRRARRPVMPVVDGVATLPLDAAAMQRGYT
ncbi:MAG: formate dehydrogenase accessory protein FdhE [Acidobacteria bacterium]|nr:formate dehydrogenase accessory protein FdhE [Acidobacteriota bacterium]